MRQRNSKGKAKEKTIRARVSTELKHNVDAYVKAFAHEASESEILRRAIVYYMDNHPTSRVTKDSQN